MDNSIWLCFRRLMTEFRPPKFQRRGSGFLDKAISSYRERFPWSESRISEAAAHRVNSTFYGDHNLINKCHHFTVLSVVFVRVANSCGLIKVTKVYIYEFMSNKYCLRSNLLPIRPVSIDKERLVRCVGITKPAGLTCKA